MRIIEKFIIRVSNYMIAYDEDTMNLSSHIKRSEDIYFGSHFNNKFVSFDNFNIKRKY